MQDDILADIDPELLALALGQVEEPKITRIENTHAPQSYLQQKLWTLQSLSPADTTYNTPVVFVVEGHINANRLEKALHRVLDKHEVFRTSFSDEQGPQQHIVEQYEFALQQFDESVSATDFVESAQLKTWLSQPFELSQAPLFRALLVSCQDDKQILAFNYHHIVSDGWSNQIILKDLKLAYEGQALHANKLRYIDFAAWQCGELTEHSQTMQFWRTYFDTQIQPILLPVKSFYTEHISFQGSSEHQVWGAQRAATLQRFCQHHQFTPASVMHALWQIVLYRHSEHDNFAIGVPNAARNDEQIQDIVGCFITTQAYRCEVDATRTFLELVMAIQDHSLSCMQHSETPFEFVQQALNLPRSPGRAAVYQVGFDCQKRVDVALSFNSFTLIPLIPEANSSKYEISMAVQTAVDSLFVEIEYRCDLFNPQQVCGFLQEYGQLFDIAMQQPNMALGNWLDQVKVVQQCDWQGPKITPSTLLTHQRVSEVAQNAPEHTAIIFNDKHFDYAWLEKTANNIAQQLLLNDITQGSVVGIMLPREPIMLASMLACFKIGAAYLPLDMKLPADKLDHILQDSGCALIIAHQILHGANYHGTWLLSNGLNSECAEAVIVDVHPAHIAYINYTSGSTGKAKGVAIPHSALTSYIDSAIEFINLTPSDVVLQFATANFDAFVEQVFPTWVAGSSLLLRADKIWDADKLYTEAKKHHVSVMDLSAAYWQHLAAAWAQKDQIELPHLRQVHSGGEAMSQHAIADWQNAGLAHIKLLNTYGPTEIVVEATIFDCAKLNTTTHTSVPLGSALANRTLYVLDPHLNVVPNGAVGELYIGGVILANGYWQNPALTAETFIADPFTQDGSRLYCTGDIVRWNNVGDLEYLGRIDHQVKIRGFRIELGEIEAQLRLLSMVDEAFVIADKTAYGDRLVAYVSGDEVDIATLRRELTSLLPDYMIPAIFMVIDALPINQNGKVDRHALPTPEIESNQEFIAPEGDIEVTLALLWQSVLGIETVSRYDNFFALGGDSISILKVVSLAKSAKLALTADIFFSTSDLSSLAAQVTRTDLDITAVTRLEQPFTGLSYAQERQWFLWKLAPHSSAYHISGALILSGTLNIDHFTQAINYVYHKHDALRSIFVESQEGVVEQFIDTVTDVQVEQLGIDVPERDNQIQQFKARLVNTPFDLTQGNLFRVGLIQTSPSMHELIVVMHHIVSDGMSIELIVDDFVSIYQALNNDKPLPLLEQRIRYSDYAQWQRLWLAQGEEARQLTYWQQVLGTDHPVLSLPADLNSDLDEYTNAQINIEVNASLKADLERFAQQQSSTIFIILMAAWHTLLYRYCGQSKIRVGIPIANRQHVGTQDIVGFFVNTQVVQSDMSASDTIIDVVQQVRKAVRGAQANQDLPFEKLVDGLNLSRDLGQQPLFQVMMNHQRLVTDKLAELPSLTITPSPLPNKTAQFELVLNSFEDPYGVLSLELNYAKERFSEARITMLLESLETILKVMIEVPETLLDEGPFLPASLVNELTTLGYGQTFIPKNNTVSYKIGMLGDDMAQPTPDEYHDIVTTLNQLARITPDAIAIVCGDTQYTFKQLHDKSSQLAYYLSKCGVTTEQRVGIALPRSADVPVAFLAVLKAGGTYVPLDLSFPDQRLNYMVNDSNIEHVIVADENLAQVLEGARLHVLDSLVLDKYWQQTEIYAAQGAYVIYTSGSTGNPKGVLVSRQSIAMHCRSIGRRYELTAADRELIFMSFCFDGAHERWLSAVTHGGSVVIRPEQQWDLQETYQNLHDKKVTTVVFPPVFLRELAAYVEQVGNPPPVRVYCFGGDAMPQYSFELAQRVLKPAFFINGYGPTETVVTPLTWKAMPGSSFDSVYAPIGEVLGHRQAWVLNEQLMRVLPGTIGELYMAEDIGLARGYLNRPDLTAEFFIANPFKDDGSRLYRTGDLVRWNRHGQMEYLGRTDHQVKIRGFRIELGEIESLLRCAQGVDEAVVVAEETPTGKRLVGYVSSSETQLPDTAQLKAHIASQLPNYMVPSILMVLPELPLNSNGKIDRKALPKAELIANNDYQAPENNQEKLIADVWSQVLGIEHIGRLDNFFDLGGDSILSLQIVAKVRRQGFVLTPKQMFEAQSVAQLAQLLVPVSEQDVIAQTVSGPVPLLPIQVDFFNSDYAHIDHWNQAMMLRSETAFDSVRLLTAVTNVVRYHDALGMRYEQAVDKTWQQVYAVVLDQQLADAVWHRNVAVDEISNVADEAQRSLSIEEGVLFRFVNMSISDGSARLLIVIHHLVIDGVSWRVLLADLAQSYQALAQDEMLKLQSKSHSYQHWANQIRSYPEAHEQEFSHWCAQTAAPLSLCYKHSNGSKKGADAASVSIELSSAQTRSLLQHAPRAYRTQVNDLLLSALSEGIHNWNGQTEVLLNLEGHGREPWDDSVDLSRTVGWFTALYPVKLLREASLANTIKFTKERLRAIPNKGLGYGAFKYFGSAEQQSKLQQQPLGNIDFNYLGQFDNSFSNDAEAGSWLPAFESTGDSISLQNEQASELSINGQVFDSKLKLDIYYSAARLHGGDIVAFADAYKLAIVALIEHCEQAARSLTPSDIPLSGLSQASIDTLPVDLAKVESVYPLTGMQQGMLFHSAFEQSNAYVNQLCFKVDQLDVSRFIAAWQLVIDRHEVLRTGFLTELIPAQQYVLDSVELDWYEQDIQGLAENAQQHAIEHTIQAQLDLQFDLQKDAGLSRIVLLKLAQGRHHLIWTNHHILNDGWSASIMMGEVLQAYNGVKLTPVKGQYQDYIEYILAQDQDVNVAYWHAQMAKLSAPSYVTSQLQGDSEVEYLEFDRALTQEKSHYLQAFAKQQRVTVNTLVQGAWALLLSRYLHQDTVCFGATTSGRSTDLHGSEEMLGMFINTIPVVTEVAHNYGISDWLRALQANNLVGREHEYTPLYEIQKLASNYFSVGQQGLFDSIVVFENYPVAEALKNAQPQETRFSVEQAREETNFPLTLSVSIGESIGITLSYQRQHISQQWAYLLAEQFEYVLDQLASPNNTCLGHLTLSSPDSLAAVLELGRGEKLGVSQKTIQHAISDHANTSGDSIAIIDEHTQLSYQQLDTQSNQLAHYLVGQGVNNEDVVAVCMTPSVELVISLLAIFKAGAVYLPIDPSIPEQRRTQVLIQSNTKLILTNIPAMTVSALSVFFNTISLADHPSADVNEVYSNDQVAYMIYTSGSTGLPKGVEVSHYALTQQCGAVKEQYAYTAQDRGLLFSTPSFDASLEQMLVPLICGASVYLSDGKSLSFEQLSTLIKQHNLTVLDLPPAYSGQLSELPAVRVCIAGGEAWQSADFKRVQELLPKTKLINAYGPTEAVITPTMWHGDSYSHVDTAYVPIGKAIGDRQLYVLDSAMALCPRGAVGELYIAGTLAQGYHLQPGLTAESFIANPFSADGERLYRTADLVRWTEDGQLEYMGRADQQVQIRGYRIELGEIEACLRVVNGVHHAVVINDSSLQQNRLIAYVSGNGLSTDILNASLVKALPEYMVPSAICILDSMPMNRNGKVDMNALPKVDEQRSKSIFRAPITPEQQVMAQIWQTVLDVEQVGLDDNFFALGGDSIGSLSVLNLWSQHNMPELSLQQLWQSQSLVMLVASLHTPRADCIHTLNSINLELANVYFFHDGYGQTIGYLPLAKHLDGQANCYGVGPDEQLMDYDDLNALAQYYADELLRHSSSSFNLVGWSLGGTLAALVAKILQTQGAKVNMLYMIDSWNPYEATLAPQLTWHEWARSWLAEEVNDTVNIKEDKWCPTVDGMKDVTDLACYLHANKSLLSRELVLLTLASLTELLQWSYQLYVLSYHSVDHDISGVTNSYCWWSEHRKAEDIVLFYHGIGQSVEHTIVAYNHQDIVAAPEVISKVTQIVNSN